MCVHHQLLRKRHIGNDIVTIVFQEPGALPFTPKSIRSHFQHVFIIVQVHEPCTDKTFYRSVKTHYSLSLRPLALITEEDCCCSTVMCKVFASESVQMFVILLAGVKQDRKTVSLSHSFTLSPLTLFTPLLSLTVTLFFSLSLFHSLCHSVSTSVSLTATFCDSLLCHSSQLSISHSVTLSYSSLSFTVTLCLSLPHTLCHTLILSLAVTLCHSLSLCLSHFITLSHSFSFTVTSYHSLSLCHSS